MLTVKHCADDGRETIHTCFRVELRPEEDCVGGHKPRRVLAFTDDHYITEEISSGRVFIMNEQGCTVQQYHLGPQGGSAAA